MSATTVRAASDIDAGVLAALLRYVSGMGNLATSCTGDAPWDVEGHALHLRECRDQFALVAIAFSVGSAATLFM